MQIRTFLSYVREEYTAPIIIVPKWPVALLIIVLSGLSFFTPAYLLAHSRLPSVALLAAGILIAIAYAVFVVISSRKNQTDNVPQPLPAIEKAFSRSITDLLTLTFLLIFGAYNYYSNILTGLDERYFLIGIPTVLSLYIFAIYVAIRRYKQMRRAKVGLE